MKSNHKNKITKRLKNIFFTPLFLAFTNIYLEVLFHIFVYENGNIFYPIVLSIPTGLLVGLIIDLFADKIAKVLRYVAVGIVYLVFGVQLVYHHVFKDLMTWALIGMAGDVAKGFLKDTLIGIWESLLKLIIMALPFVLLWLLTKKLQIKNKPYLKKTIIIAVLFVLCWLLSLLFLLFGGTKTYTPFDLYHNRFNLSLAGEKLGIITSTRKDINQLLFGNDNEGGSDFHDVTLPVESKETEEQTVVTELQTDENGGTVVVEKNPYNSIEKLDFEALANSTTDSELKSIFSYLAKQTPTKKNQYTGMFEGYNLVMICAESFSPVCISEELTPTLYKLANSGFVFDNYWTSYPSVTTNGEYSFLTGLFPDFEKPKKNGSFLFSAENKNTMNQTIASWFLGHSIQPIAYHPNIGTYYSRNLTHTNLGYVFHAKENYPDLTGWPESDLTLVQSSIKEYIDSDRFQIYIMSVSGHHNYKFGGYNDIADKNKSLVEDYDLTKLGMNFDLTNSDDAEMAEHAKAYLACNIELDRALQYLIEELEQKGILDKTVICLSTDHYPYGLEDVEYAKMLGYKKAGSMKYDRMERYKSTLILWNSAMETVKVTKPCCTVDVLPTLLNLFGFEFDSRLYSGRDILSDSYGLAMLANQSFITDKIAYNTLYNLSYKIDKSYKATDDYLNAYISEVNNRFTIATKILNSDFYAYLPKDIISEAQSK